MIIFFLFFVVIIFVSVYQSAKQKEKVQLLHHRIVDVVEKYNALSNERKNEWYSEIGISEENTWKEITTRVDHNKQYTPKKALSYSKEDIQLIKRFIEWTKNRTINNFCTTWTHLSLEKKEQVYDRLSTSEKEKLTKVEQHFEETNKITSHDWQMLHIATILPTVIGVIMVQNELLQQFDITEGELTEMQSLSDTSLLNDMNGIEDLPFSSDDSTWFSDIGTSDFSNDSYDSSSSDSGSFD
ncbi:MAG: hypothetical protein ACRCWQ_14345 [Bacilli bacterium]